MTVSNALDTGLESFPAASLSLGCLRLVRLASDGATPTLTDVAEPEPSSGEVVAAGTGTALLADEALFDMFVGHIHE